MSIKIKSDGTPSGTKVTTEDGAGVSGIVGINLNITGGQPIITATIEVMVGELELENINGEIVAHVINDKKVL